MNQPLDFVAHDLEMMIPGGTPMITGGNMYNTSSPGQMGGMPPGPGGFGSQGGFGGPGYRGF